MSRENWSNPNEETEEEAEPSSDETGPENSDQESGEEEAFEQEHESSPESEEDLSSLLEEERRKQDEEIVEEMRASLDEETKEKIQDTFQGEINRLKKEFIEEHELDDGGIRREPGEILEDLRNNEDYREEREEIEKLEVMQAFFKAEENPSYENQFVALDTLNKIAQKMEERGETEEARFKEILELRETIAENIVPGYEREEEREGSEADIEAKRKEIIRKEIEEKVDGELREAWGDNEQAREYYEDNCEELKNLNVEAAIERAQGVLEGVEGNEEEALLYLLKNEDGYTLEDIQHMNEKEEEYQGGKLTSWLIKPLEKAGEWVGDKLHQLKILDDWMPKEEREKAVRVKRGVIEVDNKKFKDEFEKFQRELHEERKDEIKKEFKKDQKENRHEGLIDLRIDEENVKGKYNEIKEKLIENYAEEREEEESPEAGEEESSGESTESEETEEDYEGEGVDIGRLLEDIRNGETPDLDGEEGDEEKIKNFFADRGFQSDEFKRKIERIVQSEGYKRMLVYKDEKEVFEWILLS